MAGSGSGLEMRAAHFPGRAPVDAYGNGGFRFADMSHRGHLLMLPSGIYGWEPRDPEALVPDDFSRIIADAAEIEFLLVGTGPTIRFLPKSVRAVLKDAGVPVDPMSTGAAVRTYNVMLAESRPVAAACIAV